MRLPRYDKIKFSSYLFFIIIFFQNCHHKNPFKTNDTVASITLPSQAGQSTTKNITDISNSILCHQWVTGNDQNGTPIWSDPIGNCSNTNLPLFLMSVTHENECNTHLPCKDYSYDLNYKPNISAYMADYYPKDIGTWLKYSAKGDQNSSLIELALDTINFGNYLTPSGRPASNGYLFYGLNFLHLNNQVTLNDQVWIEFDYRIRNSELGNSQKAGHRMMVGASLDWTETNRSNRSHFFEINLFKTPDFHKDHFNINSCPKDIPYDFCFYDPNGKWAEGKYVSSGLALGSETHSADDQWRNVRINIFDLIKKVTWFHFPSDWNQAKTSGFYIGLESKDKSHLYVSLRNLRIYKVGTQIKPPPSQIESTSKISMNGSNKPIGLFRDGVGGYKSNGLNYCHFNSGSELIANSYTQNDYENARQFSRSLISLPYAGTCKDTIRMGIVRQNSAGLIKNAQGYCVITSGTHLLSCGYRQFDYDSAPQIYVGEIGKLQQCYCN